METKQWNIFKMLKGNNYQPRILYPVKISSRNKDKIKTPSEKQKQRLLKSRHVLKENTKGTLQA